MSAEKQVNPFPNFYGCKKPCNCQPWTLGRRNKRPFQPSVTCLWEDLQAAAANYQALWGVNESTRISLVEGFPGEKEHSVAVRDHFLCLVTGSNGSSRAAVY